VRWNEGEQSLEKVAAKGGERRNGKGITVKAPEPFISVTHPATEFLRTIPPDVSADSVQSEESQRKIKAGLLSLNETVTEFNNTLAKLDFVEKAMPLKLAKLEDGISAIIEKLIGEQSAGALTTIGPILSNLCKALKLAPKNFWAASAKHL